MKRNLIFDQVLAFLAGSLTPVLPLLGSDKPHSVLIIAALLGGVVGLRLFRNTAFGDATAAERAESLASASKNSLGYAEVHYPPPAKPATDYVLPAIVPPAGYISPTAT